MPDLAQQSAAILATFEALSALSADLHQQGDKDKAYQVQLAADKLAEALHLLGQVDK